MIGFISPNTPLYVTVNDGICILLILILRIFILFGYYYFQKDKEEDRLSKKQAEKFSAFLLI